MHGTGGRVGASRSQQGRDHLSLPIPTQEGPAPVPDGLPGRGLRPAAEGHAYLVELHVIVLDALHPVVLAVGANVLPLLVPYGRQEQGF